MHQSTYVLLYLLKGAWSSVLLSLLLPGRCLRKGTRGICLLPIRKGLPGFGSKREPPKVLHFPHINRSVSSNVVFGQRCFDVPIVDCIHAVAVVVMRLGQHLHFADYIWARPLGILEPELVPNIESAIGSVMLSASFLALSFR